MSLTCFSPLTTVRCYGEDWSKVQHIVTYIPSGPEVLVLFPLVAITYARPSATLLLLALEILVHVGVSTWNLALQLGPPAVGIFRTNDTALAIISPIPLLLFHIFLTSHLLHLRPIVSSSLRSKRSTILFSALVAPLVPISFVAGLIPVFFTSTLNYRSVPGRVPVVVRYTAAKDADWARTVGIVGVACGATYILFGTVVVVVQALMGQGEEQRQSRARSQIDTHSQWGEWSIALGMILAIVDLGLSIPDATFVFLILRNVLRFISRLALVVGFVVMARHVKNRSTAPLGTSMLGADGRGAKMSQVRGGGEGKGGKATRETIATFGTPSSFLAYQFGQPSDPMPAGGIGRRPTLASKRSDSKSGRKGSRPARLVIGGPVKGSFKRLQTGLDGGRDWYDLNSARFGMGVIGAQMSGVGSPVRYDVQRQENSRTNPDTRTASGRLPALSFRESTFTTSSLDKLVSTLRDSVQAFGNISANDPSGHANANAKANVSYRPRHGGMQADDPLSYEYSAGLRSTSTATVRKNVGSIYSPDRISVDESELARWPPSPPDTKIPRDDFGGPIFVPSSNPSWDGSNSEMTHPKPQPQPQPQIQPGPIYPQPGPTKRDNSIKRKPVPNLDSPIPSQAFVPSSTSDDERKGKQVRISTYFTSRAAVPVPLRNHDHGIPCSVHANEADGERQEGGLVPQQGGERREGRPRAGTATERRMWYGPVSQRSSDARSTIYFTATATPAAYASISDDQPEDRPGLGRRRSTDPTLVILAPLDFPLPSSAQERYEKARVSATSRRVAARSMFSPTSVYSDIEGDDATCPCAANGGSRLFYMTPIQSPELDQEGTMDKFPPSPSSSSMGKNPFSSSQETTRLTPQDDGTGDRDTGPHLRQSELQGVLARLTRIQRETGLDMNRDMDADTDLEAAKGSEMYFNGQNSGSRGSMMTFTTIDSMLGSEDLTPVAGIYTGQSFGPRV
ncbi:hypothetical protein IAT40_002686 [Kwoniella sp. CBS 6097]